MNYKIPALLVGAVTLIGMAGCTATGQIPSALVGSGPAGTSAPIVETVPEAVSDAPKAPEGQNSRDDALAAARTLVNEMAEVGVSRMDLLAMLGHHGWFSNEDATYAVDNLGINWSAQALKAAQYWKKVVGDINRTEMVEHLKARGFTSAQVNYAVSELGLKDSTSTPSADVTAPPAVTPTSPATSPSQPSANSTLGTNG